jgi:hypothetical protein
VCSLKINSFLQIRSNKTQNETFCIQVFKILCGTLIETKADKWISYHKKAEIKVNPKNIQIGSVEQHRRNGR